MRHQIIIDGINIYDQYGVFILSGSYKSIINPPKIKPIPFTDWKDIDGLDYDASIIKYEERKIAIKLFVKTKKECEDFLAFLHQTSTRTWNFVAIGYEISLRIVSINNFVELCSGYSFVVNVNEDDPFAWYDFEAAIEIPKLQGLSIDNIDVSEYGVSLLKGYFTEFSKPFQTKENLKINSKSVNGTVYPAETVIRGTSPIKLHCYINGSYAIVNMNALFFNLSQPGFRLLKYNQKSFKCLLKSVEVISFDIGRKWLEININIELIKQL